MGKRGFGGGSKRRFPSKKWPLAILLGAIAAIVVSRGRSVISAAPKTSKAAVQEIATDVKTMFGKDANPEESKPMEPAEAATAPERGMHKEETMPVNEPRDARQEPENAESTDEQTNSTPSPAATETIEAGVDESGTFRPTKVEADDYGVVVTDTEPAGLEATTGWVKGDGSPSCPENYPIKGNANSRIYHLPGSPTYDQTIPEMCFADEDSAALLGYRPRKA